MMERQKNSQLNPSSLIKWGDIVKLVQRANMQEAEAMKLQESQRKKAYKEELDMQIQEHHRNAFLAKNMIARERTELDQKSREDTLNESQAKKFKLKTEQKYQVENFELTNIKKRNVQNLERYGENPFIVLVDQQDARRKQTKINFKLQNKLNDMQIAIRQENQMNMKMEGTKHRIREANFLQQLDRRGQKQKQRFKNKYLAMRRWEKQMISSNESSLQKRYGSFLDHQISQEKSKKIRQKYYLDEEQARINKKSLIPDSSPAYLGRIPCSNDRQKQLSIVDSKLYNKSGYKMRASSQLYKSVEMHGKNETKQYKKQKQAQQNMSPPPNSWKLKNPFLSEEKAINRKLININLRDGQAQPSQRRQYLKYDFISGSHRTIMI